MNLDKMISKLETIASRINDPIHVGFKSSLEGAPLGVLFTVKEIYVFGSAVYADDPNDLDISIVTERADQMLWEKFCDEKYHASEYWQMYGHQQLVKKTLLRKMRNVDIHVDDFETIPTKLRILVWSRVDPNVKENFLAGRETVDLAPECRSLRKQAKITEAKNYVLEKLCRMFSNEEAKLLRSHGVFRGRSTLSDEELIEARALQNLDEYFTKKDLPRLKLFFEGHGIGEWDYIDFDLIKKFIEIKEKKGSKKIFERLDWDPKARARAEEQDEWDRTERKKDV